MIMKIEIYLNYGTILHGISKIGKGFLENHKRLIFLTYFLIKLSRLYHKQERFNFKKNSQINFKIYL